MMTELPDSEFTQRIKTIQAKLSENNYDAYLVHCNEADQANVRYLSDHWPIFETAGVIVPREGEPILLIGPEAEPFAVDRSRIKKIRKMDTSMNTSPRSPWLNVHWSRKSTLYDPNHDFKHQN